MRHFTCVSVLALLMTSSCGGTETDNPLTEFKRTGCKNHGETALTLAADVAPSEPLPESREYDGLYCFDYAYDEDEKQLEIKVFNYPSACGSEFASASAETFHGWMRLSLERTSCDVPRCGNCYYDLSFKVAVDDLTGPYMVELNEVGCEGTNGYREGSVVFINSGEEQETGTTAYCATLGEPIACESDDDCRAGLERCGDEGECEPLMSIFATSM